MRAQQKSAHTGRSSTGQSSSYSTYPRKSQMSSSITTPYLASGCRLNGCFTALQCSREQWGTTHKRKSGSAYEKCSELLRCGLGPAVALVAWLHVGGEIGR